MAINSELLHIMILTAHQPQYLPGLRLFDKIARADVFVHLDTVPMESSGYENRNKIKTAHGPKWLTVPVNRQGYQGKPIHKIEIDWMSSLWEKKHYKSIVLAYAKSQHFEWFLPHLDNIYANKQRFLSEFNLRGLKILLKALNIDTRIIVPKDGYFEGHKSDLVLDMCKKLGATKYIFGQHGRVYAKVEDFEREGIEVEFQDYQHPVYRQLHGPFVENMSVIDLLFNEGPRSLEILVNK